jgi:hypothetical protein
MNDDDLKFSLEPEVDLGKLESELASVQKAAEAAAKKAADALAKIDAQNPELARRRDELRKITDELVKQHKIEQETVRLHQSGKGTVSDKEAEEALRRQSILEEAILQSEREQLEVAKKLAEAREAGEAAGAGGEAEQGKLDIKSVLSTIKQGGLLAGVKEVLAGIDLPQLLAGAFGAYSGQGAGGALGSVFGGIAGSGGAAVPAGGQAAGQVAGAAVGGGADAAAGALKGIGMEAVAGPIGLAVMAAEAAAKVAGELYSVPFKGIASGLELVDKGLRGLQGPLGPVGVGLDAVAGGLESVREKLEAIPILGDVLGPTLGALAAVPAALKGILESLTGFAALASPAQFGQLSVVLRDVQAVLGHAFLPAMELMRHGIRLVGDVMASFLPNSREMRAALSDARGALRDVSAAVRQALGELGPEVRSQVLGFVRWVSGGVARLASVMVELVGPMTELSSIALELSRLFGEVQGAGLDLALDAMVLALRGVATVVRWAVSGLEFLIDSLSLLGLISRGIAEPGRPRSLTGAAAMPAQFNSIDSYQQQLQLAAFTEPSGPTMDEVPGTVNRIANTLDAMLDLLSGGIGVRMLSAIGDAASDLAGRVIPPALASETGSLTGRAAGTAAAWLRDTLGLE